MRHVLLLAAILPGLYWDKGPETAAAVKKSGVERVYVPAAKLDGWSKQGLTASAADPAQRKKLTAPGVQYRMNEAAATSLPWIDANGWQFLRDPGGKYYYDVPAADVPLAMAESYAYGADALIHPAGDLEPFARMLEFLKRIDRPALPAMANIGVVDDGSDITGEAMNLLARRNLLFRAVKAPDSKLDLNLTPGKDADAADPYGYAQKVRQKLGDDRRLVRLYGSEVVIAHLTGDGSRLRLHLINYTNRKVVGLRVRLRGTYAKGEAAAYGIEKPALEDYATADGETEFTVPEMGTYAVIDLVRK
jgi:hypothetical protein